MTPRHLSTVLPLFPATGDLVFSTEYPAAGTKAGCGGGTRQHGTPDERIPRLRICARSDGCARNLHGRGLAEKRQFNEPQDARCETVSNVDLRILVLGYVASAEFLGNRQVEAMAALANGFSDQILALNRALTDQFKAAPYIERFGMHRQPVRGSIIVCRFGKTEFLALQNCLFSGRPGIEDYEFTYTLNSPELGEKLLQEARAASMTYGVPQTVVVLSGNAGFGAANNAGAAVARSNRIMNVNPDVFPYDPNWAARHTELLDLRPAEETRLFGAALYYDDGSLMHGGMYFEMDTGISARAEAVRPCRMVRTEHYGKGAPAWAEQFVRARPVPAITGAFISSDRAWYEALGGFTEDYIFGHYEDADLCLKSLQRGTVSWMHDLRLWHLEGKGSTRLPPHEGGSIVNRWLFSKLWAETIEDGLCGPNPTHPALAQMPTRKADGAATPPGSRRERRGHEGPAGQRFPPGAGTWRRPAGLL